MQIDQKKCAGSGWFQTLCGNMDGALLFNGAIAVSGSTHLSVNRTVKEAQACQLWLPRTPRAHDVSDALVRCLHSADARRLIASIPGSDCRTRHIVKYVPTTTSPLLLHVHLDHLSRTLHFLHSCGSHQHTLRLPSRRGRTGRTRNGTAARGWGNSE